MLLPGLEKDEIIHLKLDDAGNVVYELAEDPALLTGSQIYQEFFGLDKIYPTDTGKPSTDSVISPATRTDRTTEEVEMQRLHTKLRRPEWSRPAAGRSAMIQVRRGREPARPP